MHTKMSVRAVFLSSAFMSIALVSSCAHDDTHSDATTSVPRPPSSAAPSAPAGPSERDKPHPSVSDSVLTARVKGAIAGRSKLRTVHVQVSSASGIVHISGSVVSAEQIGEILDVVRGVEGVQDIDDDLQPEMWIQ